MSVSSTTGVLSGVSTGISLRQILPDANFQHGNDICVQSCAGSVSECQSDDLFVAIVHPDRDGHDDVATAIDLGATAILTEQLLPFNVPQCIVEDSRIAYGKICQALAGNPCHRINTIAVSGTDGKTTTAHLVASILETAGKATGLCSSITRFSDKQQPAASLTAASLTAASLTAPGLAETVARTATDGNQHLVIEVNSMELARHQFAGMSLDVVVITNTRGNRFNFHHNMANYRRSQMRLLEYLKPTGVVVLNADDPGTWFQLDRIEKETPATLTIGIRQDANVQGRVIESDLHEQTFTVTAGDESVIVRTKIAGVHHVYNCLAAAATCLLQGIDLETIARGLERVEELPGRMNVVNCGQSFDVAVDEANTPYRLGVALNTLKKKTTGRIFCVFSTPDSMDPQTASQYGCIVERSCNVPVLTRPAASSGRQSSERLNYEPAHRVLDGFKRPAGAQIIPDRIKAIEWALSKAKAGDAVLIAGRGDKSIASMSEGRWQLTDSEVCQSWFYGETTPCSGIPTAMNPTNIFHIDDYRPC